MKLEHSSTTEHYLLTKNDGSECIGNVTICRHTNDYRGSNVTCYDNEWIIIKTLYTDLPTNRLLEELLRTYKEHYNEQ